MSEIRATVVDKQPTVGGPILNKENVLANLDVNPVPPDLEVLLALDTRAGD